MIPEPVPMSRTAGCFFLPDDLYRFFDEQLRLGSRNQDALVHIEGFREELPLMREVGQRLAAAPLFDQAPYGVLLRSSSARSGEARSRSVESERTHGRRCR